MGRGILAAQLSRFDEIMELTGVNSVWKRREGFNLNCTFGGAIKSAFVLREDIGILRCFAYLLPSI
ncbi:MAG: hypothetical protein LBC27_08025 [Spirochaetaceae bacterium]|nr:hypothetical protein [Spirochaetaceae bacterium]